LISKFLDTTAVGVYSVAYRFTYAFQFLPLAFVASLYPGMSAVVGKDAEALKRIFLKGMWYMGLACVPLVFGIWALAQDLVLLAGEEYLSAIPVLQILIFVLIPIFLDFPIGSLLNASDKQSTKTKIMGATMIINIVLNLLFIPNFGIIGAAYAAFVCLGFMFVAGLMCVPSLLPTFRFVELLKILIPIFLSGLVMLLFVLFFKSIFVWYLLVPIGALTYTLCLFVTGALRVSDLKLFGGVWSG
jgi:O-antigen/teichoic acid export membrane protein